MTREAMFEAIDAGDGIRLEELLADAPGLAGERDDEGVSAALHARYRNDHGAVALLLAASPELDIFDAAGLGLTDRLQELLATDSSLATSFSADGFTPLHLAAFFGHAEAAALLLDNAADPNAVARNPLGVMALHSAAAGSHLDVARLLVAAGGDVNATHQHDYSPLHAAGQNGDEALADLLLAAGADPSARTTDGETAADLAEAAGHVEVARRLAEYAAK